VREKRRSIRNSKQSEKRAIKSQIKENSLTRPTLTQIPSPPTISLRFWGDRKKKRIFLKKNQKKTKKNL